MYKLIKNIYFKIAGKVHKNLAIVQQKKYLYLTRFKNVAFHAKFFYALRRRGPHHVICLRAPHHPRSTPVPCDL